MKTFIALVLTLFIINLAAKAHTLAPDNPYKNEKTNRVKPRLLDMFHFGKTYPKHHSKKCKHAQHRKLSSINKAVRGFLKQQLAIVHTEAYARALHSNPYTISSPVNNQRMNEQEWIFYRKLQRLKLA